VSELLDIVDATDRVIGQASRDDIHREQHLHRATHIVLSNSRGEVFVQLRSNSKDNNPGMWDTSAAGHVDAGESYVGCAVREVREELGVEVSPEQLEFVSRLHPSPENGFEFVMVYRAISDDPLSLQADEVADGRWLSPHELDHWIETQPTQFTTDFRMIWKTVRDKGIVS